MAGGQCGLRKPLILPVESTYSSQRTALLDALEQCQNTLRFIGGRNREKAVRIAIPYAAARGWTAQQSLTRSIVNALCDTASEVGGEVEFLVLGQKDAPSLEGVPKGLGIRLAHVARADWNDPARRQALLDSMEISVVLNLYQPPVQTGQVGNVGWIYDFQHVVLPEYFTEEERKSRDERFRNVAEFCDLVLLSSQDACRDFANFAPDFAAKARCHPFPSALTPESIAGVNPEAVPQSYHLPEKYALVANQFWAHKNHKVVIDAIALCRKRGLDIPAIFTGLPLDHRDSNNAYTSFVLQQIAKAGVADLVIPLGLVPYPDLIALLRCAALVIQPSRMEGWSTTVQDAKSLGRPLACSDIAVLQEQAPNAIGFFPCDGAGQLADLLAAHWSSLSPGPDLELEKSAMAKETAFGREYGQGLWRTCIEAANRARQSPPMD